MQFLNIISMDFNTILSTPFVIPIILVSISSLLFMLTKSSLFHKPSSHLPQVPKVPGLPLLGNLLQLKEKKPYKTFTKWAEIYGPIYSIKLGSSHMIVLNNSDVAKEAMVTRFSSISTRKLSNALTILTHDKCMVATSDYNEFHKLIKKFLLNYMLGPTAQKRNRAIRDTMLDDIVQDFHTNIKSNPLQVVNFRDIFETALLILTLKEVVGRDVQSLYVEELGKTLSRNDIYNILVLDMMEGAIEVDWRDFFPYLKWVPNSKVEKKIRVMDFRRQVVMKALIEEQKRRIEAGEVTNSYLDFMLSEAKTMTIKESQLGMLLWEPIVESADTTLVTAEWAMFELAKNPDRQDRLYREIQTVCGSDKVTEDHLPQLPYLSAIFHETLRKYSPAPMVPVRYVHEDTQIGGYHIPAGSEIIINLYGCNRDKKQWENADEWNPERFLDHKKYEQQDLYKTMAFGAGKRICAGSLQAMLISCTGIGRLVQEFEWKLQPGEEENVNTVGLTTHKLHPLRTIVKPRFEK